jgi:AbrB family transcriptional regulator (stage V sporulation protein T)
LDKPVGSVPEECMENRKTVSESTGGTFEICKDMPEEYSSLVVAPIVAGGDPIGTVILLSKSEGVQMSELEKKMAETAAAFLAKQMEQ